MSKITRDATLLRYGLGEGDHTGGTPNPNPLNHFHPTPNSRKIPGLVAQGRTIAEALDIARDVARELIEARREREGEISFPTASNHRGYTIVVAA